MQGAAPAPTARQEAQPSPNQPGPTAHAPGGIAVAGTGNTVKVLNPPPKPKRPARTGFRAWCTLTLILYVPFIAATTNWPARDPSAFWVHHLIQLMSGGSALDALTAAGAASATSACLLLAWNNRPLNPA